MNNSAFDYVYDNTQKLVRKNLEENDTIFEDKKVNFHYNCTDGNFYKELKLMSQSDVVMLNISAYVSTNAQVTIKINGTNVFNETFSSFVFVNEFINVSGEDVLEIFIIKSGQNIKNINISLCGKVDIKPQEFLLTYNENSISAILGEVKSYSGVSNLLSGFCDIKYNNSVKYFDIAYNYNANSKKENLLILYAKNNKLYLKNQTSNLEVVVTELDTMSACVVPVASINYYVVFVSKGKTYVATIASDMTVSSTSVVESLKNYTISEVKTINGDAPASKFIAKGENNVLVVDVNLNMASPFNMPVYSILSDAKNVSAFYVGGNLYIILCDLNSVEIVILQVSTGINKVSQNMYYNYSAGFVFDDKIYLVRNSNVYKTIDI